MFFGLLGFGRFFFLYIFKKDPKTFLLYWPEVRGGACFSMMLLCVGVECMIATTSSKVAGGDDKDAGDQVPVLVFAYALMLFQVKALVKNARSVIKLCAYNSSKELPDD